MEADGSWWGPWSSKPVWGVKSVPGVFDSHTSPPVRTPRRLLATATLMDWQPWGRQTGSSEARKGTRCGHATS